MHEWDLSLYSGGVRWRWYIRDCQEQIQGTWVALPPFPPVADELAELLRTRRLPVPEGRFAPMAEEMIVTLGTWFWIDPAQQTAEYDVSVAFPNLRVSVSARPSRLVFDPGDGGAPQACDAPGPVWEAALGDGAESPCMYVFEHSSSIAGDDRFHTSLSIEWDTWMSIDGVRTRELDPQSTSSDYVVTVKEIQAIVTA